MSIGQTLPPKSPMEFEGRNIRTPKRSSSVNDLYLIQFEVTREAWEALETIPKDALLGGVIWYHDGDDDAPIELAIKPPRKKDMPKAKGEHSRYWQEMFKAGFNNYPDLQELLGEASGIKDVLKDMYKIESLTFLSPETFEDYCSLHCLDGLVTLSRQAAAKVG